MATMTRTKGAAKNRYNELKKMLEERRRELLSEVQGRIDAALRRLEEGTYGDCFECGDQISEARLRALPFAVRCKDCEEARETAEQRERALAKRGSSGLFFDMSS
jgi:DnaK suppressor protein